MKTPDKGTNDTEGNLRYRASLLCGKGYRYRASLLCGKGYAESADLILAG